MQSKKHIILILNRLVSGGAERQASYVADYLKNTADFKVTVMYFGKPDAVAYHWFSDRGIQMIAFGFKEKLLLNKTTGLKNIIRKLYYILRFILILRRMKPSVIIPFTYAPNILAGRYWKFTKARACIWNQRDAGISFSGISSEIAALKNCSFWISNSSSGATFINNYIANHISIIHNGVIIPEVEAKHSDRKKIRVVMLANIHSNKDHLTLLKAWNRIKEKGEIGCAELVLAGQSGDVYHEILNYVEFNQLKESVIFTGVITDVPRLLSECDISVLSSRLEGLPNGILECMACGLPVVATNNSGSVDALGVDYPFLSPPGDFEKMADHLLKLMSSADLRMKVGLDNKKRIATHFTIQEMGTKYMNILSKV